MILGIADSVNGVPIRLTDERWEHILDSHPDLASLRETLLDAVENPDYILASRGGSLGAVVVLGTSSTLKRAGEMDSLLPRGWKRRWTKRELYGAKRTEKNSHSQ